MAKTTTNNKRKSSSVRKLVPAVGMLAVSAAMLSTATYAWFTMNKDVEVTGLTMSATTTGGLEISLGDVDSTWTTTTGDSSTTSYAVTAPDMGDVSWKRAVEISDYYSDIGKLTPASSDDALDIYYVPTENVVNAGQNVDSDATVSAATYLAAGSGNDDNAATTLAKGYNLATSVDNKGSDGYYIDIPMWIRTSGAQSADMPVYCAVKIADGADNTTGSLKNAVRVAIIPIADDNDATTETGGLAVGLKSEYTVDSTVKSDGKASIFGLKSTTWNNNNGSSAVLTNTGAYSTALGAAPTLTTAISENTTDAKSGNNTTVFTLKKTSSTEQLSVVGFVARVWLEGESDSCWDATAGQNWQIDFYFSTSSTFTT